MSETPPENPKLDLNNFEQRDLFYSPEITKADYDIYRLPKNISGKQVMAAIAVSNTGAVRAETLHRELREISNQTPTKFIRQFISWIIELTVPERLTWLQWITENTSRIKQRSQIFKKFTEQVKRGFSLANPDLNALFILFAEYNKSKDYNREIQTALKKYLNQYDPDSKTNTQK